MKKKSGKVMPISRRGLLPLLAGGLLFPFLGMGNTEADDPDKTVESAEEYQTLLRSDGTVVKVKKKAVQDSKVIEKALSNKSLRNWLDKK